MLAIQQILLTISPLFSKKLFGKLQNNLLENGSILSEEAKIVDIFNEFFSNVIKELKIEEDDNLLTDVIEETVEAPITAADVDYIGVETCKDPCGPNRSDEAASTAADDDYTSTKAN